MAMNEIFNENTEYEILTPDGWCNFSGISKNNKGTIELTFEDGTKLNATKEHIFFINNIKVKVNELCENDIIDPGKKIISIIDNKNNTDVYDLIEVDNVKHQYLINEDIITSNCDELAYVPPNIAKEFWTSISPTLSTGGRAMITSTPNSDEDLFATLWHGANKTEDAYGNETDLGINGYKAFKALWYEHPDRDEEWANREKGELGEEKFKREHECEFIIDDETLINSMTLLTLTGKDPIYKEGQVRWYKQPIPGNFYTVSLDPSLGTGGDPSAIQVFDANTSEQIAEWKHNKTTCQAQIRLLAKIVEYIAEKTYSKTSCYYSIENNTLGEASLVSLDNYGEHNIPGVMLSQPKIAGSARRFRKGFLTTNKSKLSACSKLKNLIESKRMTINSKSLISEFKNFVATNNSYAAKPGNTDDLVMSTLLAIRMMTQLQDYHKELSNNMSDYQDERLAPMPFIALF